MNYFFVTIGVWFVLFMIPKVFRALFAIKKANKSIIAYIEYYLGLNRDFLIYVSDKGFDNWKKVQGNKKGAFLTNEGDVKKSHIKNFCVCYSSGELVQFYQNVIKLPEGAYFIEENEGLGFEEIAFGDVDFSGAEIEITNKPSKNPCGVDYETTIKNKTGEKLYPIAFGGYALNSYRETLVLNNVIDSAYSAEQFKNWYGMKADFIGDGESVSDPNNYGDGGGYWVYVFKTESGEQKIVGCSLRGGAGYER